MSLSRWVRLPRNHKLQYGLFLFKWIKLHNFCTSTAAFVSKQQNFNILKKLRDNTIVMKTEITVTDHCSKKRMVMVCKWNWTILCPELPHILHEQILTQGHSTEPRLSQWTFYHTTVQAIRSNKVLYEKIQPWFFQDEQVNLPPTKIFWFFHQLCCLFMLIHNSVLIYNSRKKRTAKMYLIWMLLYLFSAKCKVLVNVKLMPIVHSFNADLVFNHCSDSTQYFMSFSSPI